MSNFIYNSVSAKLGNKEIDLDNDTLKICLLTAAYMPSQSHIYYTDLTNEINTGFGYTLGGATLTDISWTEVPSSSGVTRLTIGTSPSWSFATFTVRYAVIYDNTASGKPLICLYDFLENKSPVNGTLLLNFNNDIILQMGKDVVIPEAPPEEPPPEEPVCLGSNDAATAMGSINVEISFSYSEFGGEGGEPSLYDVEANKFLAVNYTDLTEISELDYIDTYYTASSEDGPFTIHCYKVGDIPDNILDTTNTDYWGAWEIIPDNFVGEWIPSGSYWLSTTDGAYELWLREEDKLGSDWITDYRPTHMRITFTGAPNFAMILRDKNGDYICSESYYESGMILELTWGTYDIDEISMIADALQFRVSAIEFFDVVEGETLDISWEAVEDGGVWSIEGEEYTPGTDVNAIYTIIENTNESCSNISIYAEWEIFVQT